MATDPNDIRLSPELKRIVAEKADSNGKSWQSVLEDALGPGSVEKNEDNWLDTEYVKWCEEQRAGKAPVSLAEVRQALSTIEGSLSDVIVAERDES